MKKKTLLLGLLVAIESTSVLRAQQAGYSQTNLVSNTAGVATTTDPQLLNPWGISFLAGQDFWIANNNSGTSTLYDAHGTKNALVVTIPGATRNPNGNCNPGCPTGTVSNANGTYFSGGTFIFDTEDGLIVSWTGGASAAVAFDNSASGAVYKGLAMVNSTFLLPANFNSGKIDVFDSNFRPASLSGSFTNPSHWSDEPRMTVVSGLPSESWPPFPNPSFGLCPECRILGYPAPDTDLNQFE